MNAAHATLEVACAAPDCGKRRGVRVSAWADMETTRGAVASALLSCGWVRVGVDGWRCPDHVRVLKAEDLEVAR